jgi:hypothetical protein
MLKKAYKSIKMHPVGDKLATFFRLLFFTAYKSGGYSARFDPSTYKSIKFTLLATFSRLPFFYGLQTSGL